MKPALAITLGCLMASFTSLASAASIVKVTYSQGDDTVAQMVYTGPDGGPQSDPLKYWGLLGKAPQAAYEVAIKPDKAGGKTATLEGKIKVTVEIRNQFNMGTVKTDKLKLVRNNGDSKQWYLPTEELKRIQALLKSPPKGGSN